MAAAAASSSRSSWCGKKRERDYPSFMLPLNPKAKTKTKNKTNVLPNNKRVAALPPPTLPPPVKRLCRRTDEQKEDNSQFNKQKQVQEDRNSELETKNLHQDKNPIEKNSNSEIQNLHQDEDRKQQEIRQVYAVYKEIDSGSTYSLYAMPVRPPSSSSQELDPVLKFKNVFPGSRIFVWGSRVYMFGGVAADELPVQDQELSVSFGSRVYKRTWKKDVFFIDFSQLQRQACAATPTPCAPMNGGKFCPYVIPVDVSGRTKICVFNADLGDALVCSGRPNFELYDPDSDTWTALPEPIRFDQGHDFALGVGGESSFRIKEHNVLGSWLFIFISLYGIYAIDCSKPLGGWNHITEKEGQGLGSIPIVACKLYASESAPLAFDGETASPYKQLIIVRENPELPHQRAVFEGNVMDYATCALDKKILCNLDICRGESVVSLVLKISRFKERDKGNKNAAAGSFVQVSETTYALRCLSPQDEGCLVGCFCCGSVSVC